MLRGLLVFLLLVGYLLTTTVTDARIVVSPAAGEKPSASSTAAMYADMITRLNPKGDEIRAQQRPTSSSPSPLSDTCGAEPTFPVGSPVVVTFPTATGDRQAVVYIPESYTRRQKESGSQRVALQLLFHGLNDNCERFIKNTGFQPFADQDGYILVSACGSWGMLGVGWNAGMCCGFAGKNPDDVAFARQIVDTISEGACIDRSKVFTAGFSNGAMLAEVLGCEAPDVFRAVASVSGVVEIRPGNAEGLVKCDEAIAAEHGAARPSVLMIHGDADSLVPWGGSSLLGFPDMPSNVEGWRMRNGCSEDSHNTINNTKFVNTIYTACGNTEDEDIGANTVELVHVLGGGHQWPERDGFSTTEYIYTFGKNAFGSY